jgi:hypothetical protein
MTPFEQEHRHWPTAHRCPSASRARTVAREANGPPDLVDGQGIAIILMSSLAIWGLVLLAMMTWSGVPAP